MEKLRETLTQDDVVIFVGSGISLWSGLPTWSGLIEQLAVYVEHSGGDPSLVRSEQTKGDLLQAASYGFDTLTKQQIGEFIRTACKYGAAKPHEIHKKIVAFNARCYITTNYDNLVEQSLSKWLPDAFFPPAITNRQLTETANIVSARATHFVFKPHGDAGDADSIVLTREQYRDLLPQGERHFALEALKTLLATRPVVYLGFGLRDPDFLYLRDLLANTYKGGTRDHYAVMSDIDDAEVSYWRRNYGIHLVGYQTVELPNGKRDHSPLLKLLDSLASEPEPDAENEVAVNDRLTLSFVRHAARLARYRRVDTEFEIRVISHRKPHAAVRKFTRFDFRTVDTFLKDFPTSAILIGLPGAGKTYALNSVAAFIAEQLHESCLADEASFSSMQIPIVADLKSYRGSIRELVNETLPTNLDIEEMCKSAPVRVFLDSFNEMPKEYREDGSYVEDFNQFFDQINTATVFIGSRTTDGLEQLDWPTYCLDQIDEVTVRAKLDFLESSFDHGQKRALVSLLQKPFFFQLVVSGRVGIPETATPRNFFQLFFSKLADHCNQRFARNIDLHTILSSCAYEAIDRGEETFSVVHLSGAIRTILDNEVIDANDVVNWLISKEVLVPYSGGRVAFVHQSITEYLAASQLAKVYPESPGILHEKLSLYRWDQALFLTLSLLSGEDGEKFFQDVWDADVVLAFTAANYLEENRDKVIAKLLKELVKSDLEFDSSHRIAWLIERHLALSDVHEPQLKALVKLGNVIGGAAVQRLVRMRGEEAKTDVLALFVDHRDDFNFCVNGLAPALRELIDVDDLDLIVQVVDSIAHEIKPDSDDEVAHGLTWAIGDLIKSMPLKDVRQKFLLNTKPNCLSAARARVLVNFVREQNTTEGLEFAGELLLKGARPAFSIYSIGRWSKDLSWSSFTPHHIDQLISDAIDASKYEGWPIVALQVICESRPDLAVYALEKAEEHSGMLRAALTYATSKNGNEKILESFRELQASPESDRSYEHCQLLRYLEIDWTTHEQLFVELLRLRNTEFAASILHELRDPSKARIGKGNIGEVEWWLNWLTEENDNGFVGDLSRVFGSFLTNESKQRFLKEFESGDKKYRSLLSYMLPLIFDDLSLDDLSADCISFILADVNRVEVGDGTGSLLGILATETFVEEKLLPGFPTWLTPSRSRFCSF